MVKRWWRQGIVILLLVLTGSLGLLVLSPVKAETPTPPDEKEIAATLPPLTSFRTINGNPLVILVATDGSAQVRYNYSPPVSPNGQFYPASASLADMGIFLWLGSAAYGPNFGARSSAYGNPPIAFTEIGQSEIGGSGTSGDPWVITTTLGAGSTGVQIAHKITYVNGQQYYLMESRINNTSGSPVTVSFLNAGDIYLKGSDAGYGYYDANTGGVGGRNQAQDWFVIFQPLTPATNYEEDSYYTIWDHIGRGGAQGTGFDNTVRLNDYIDNGAGLQWSNVAIPAGQSTTISNWLSFGTTAVVVPTPTPTPTATPVGPTPTPTSTPVGPTPTPTTPAGTPTPTSTPGAGPLLGNIKGAVFNDLNRSGSRDEGEPPIWGVPLRIESGNWNNSTSSGADGTYEFCCLTASTYNITAQAPAGYQFTTVLPLVIAINANYVTQANIGLAAITPTAPTAEAAPLGLPRTGTPPPPPVADPRLGLGVLLGVGVLWGSFWRRQRRQDRFPQTPNK